MKIYYAHPVSIYNTPQEERDIRLLNALGFAVINPNSIDGQNRYKADGMRFFIKMVYECDALAFRGFFNGQIPAGVLTEIQEARNRQIPIIELPSLDNQ